MEDTILNMLVSIAKGQGSGAQASSQPGSGLSLPLNFVGGGRHGWSCFLQCSPGVKWLVT